jgi:CobW/HypB/UreG, nucleotide-binding domain
MNASYYDTLLPVADLGDDLRTAVTGLRLPCRAVASVATPAGPVVVAFVSDSPRLSRMFAANWARARADQEPDATLYALAQPASGYGLAGAWDRTRWWSQDEKAMVVFGFGSYRLAKVCIRGICSAVSGDDTLFLHGCALSVGVRGHRQGVVITGGSGAGKTTLVAGLLAHAEYPVTVLNDDWGAVSVSSGESVFTGERMLHMKSRSILALRPGFFTSAPRDSYSYDLSELDRTARLLVRPEEVYGARWDPGAAVVKQVAVIVREPSGWLAPQHDGEAIRMLRSGGHPGAARHEAFFNGSLILRTPDDQMREGCRYQRFLDRTTVSWVNNCGTPGELVHSFISAVGLARNIAE